MSSGRTFALLVSLGIAALGILVVLAMRLTPCLAVGSICLVAAANSACRLLAVAGLHANTSTLGAGLLLMVVLSVGRITWSLGRQLRATRRFLSELRPSSLASEHHRLTAAARRVGIPDRVFLVDGNESRSFCYGFLRPRVAVSERLVRALKPVQLEALLWHERHHLERRDPLRLLLGRALRDGLSWLRLIGALERHFEMLVELAADRRAVTMQAGPTGLAGALYRLLAASGTTPRAVAVAGLSQAAQRVDCLLDPTLQPRLQLAPRESVTAVVLVAIGVCLLFL